jgi:hypothetical protein
MDETNCVQIISEYLRHNHIPHIYDNDCQIFEILIGDYCPTIQLEFSVDKNLKYIYISFHFNDYMSSGEYNNIEDIKQNLYEVMMEATNFNKGIAKIHKKVDDIKEICDEYELDFNQFLTIHY